MNTSMSVIKKGRGAVWRILISEISIEGNIYQQEGRGMQEAVIHACENQGEPFNSAMHRAAKAVWAAIENEKRPTNKAQEKDLIKKLRAIWNAAE